MSFDDRTKLLFDEKLEILKQSSILIVGIGGVGGYVAETMARTGIGKITLIDFDTITESNINRQIIALNSSIGKFKVDEMKRRILDINQNCNVDAHAVRLDKSNISHLVCDDYDYVMDAIDSVCDKVQLIKFCHDKDIKIISAMGAGNRKSIPNYTVCDIYKTYNDGLARVLRKQLRDCDVDSHLVVCSNEQSEISNNAEIGSVMYHPAMCGLVMSAFVINQLIKES